MSGFCKVMIDVSIELILGVRPALATESHRGMGTLLENVQTSHTSRP